MLVPRTDELLLGFEGKRRAKRSRGVPPPSRRGSPFGFPRRTSPRCGGEDRRLASFCRPAPEPPGEQAKAVRITALQISHPSPGGKRGKMSAAHVPAAVLSYEPHPTAAAHFLL